MLSRKLAMRIVVEVVLSMVFVLRTDRTSCIDSLGILLDVSENRYVNPRP